MTSPTRQAAFRKAALLHVSMLAFLFTLLFLTPSAFALGITAQIILVLGIVEGAALIGWRLVQLPKSQAMEFLLVTATSPRRVFLAEWFVGGCRFLCVQLAGMPLLMFALLNGLIEPPDLVVLGVMPVVWGLVAGTGLCAWIYEPVRIRRVGEILGLFGVLVYLIVGVLAAENLLLWMEKMPAPFGEWLYRGILWLHAMNPFGVMRYWFATDSALWVAQERFEITSIAALIIVLLFALRAGSRLAGHFQDRHYKPQSNDRVSQEELIGDAPLTWWAVRRVMEYSGRVNLYLAFGFCLLYGAFLVAGDAWPSWIGRGAFILFESWGGPAMVATAMVVMACVPAVYQFGLWDATVPDRCRRLELLLLTELEPRDYAHAAFNAAWSRGRGYMHSALILWIACAVADRVYVWDSIAAALGAAVLWAFSFAVGFHGFATGRQSNGVASLITLGCPMLLYFCWMNTTAWVSALVPTAAVFMPLKSGITLQWLTGLVFLTSLSTVIYLRTRARCDGYLRTWYDANQGAAVA